VDFVAKIQIDDPHHPSAPCLAYTIQNGATFVEGPIAGGEIVTLRGNGIGPQTAAFEKIGPDGKVSTELAGVRVFFDNVPAPLLYVQSQQINAVVPWEVVFNPAGTSAYVRVEYNGASSDSSIVPISDAAPGIFITDYSTQQAAVLNADGTPNSPSNRAKRGSVVTFFGTGGGATKPAGVTGGFWPNKPLAHLTQPVSVQIGNTNAEVQYAGSAPGMISGIFQINVLVPDSLLPVEYPIIVTIGGVPSPQSTAYLFLK